MRMGSWIFAVNLLKYLNTFIAFYIFPKVHLIIVKVSCTKNSHNVVLGQSHDAFSLFKN